MKRKDHRSRTSPFSLRSSFILAICILTGTASTALAQPSGTWTNGDPAVTLTDLHLLGAAARLGNGKVVAAGGLVIPFAVPFPATAKAELYDPSTHSWSVTGPLNTPRWSLDAVTLNNGKALFAGGADGFAFGVALATAEVYDPVSNTFSYTANNLSVARQGLGISTLNDGRVLFTGGNTSSGSLGGAGSTAVDIYDPATNKFTAVASMNAGRSLHAQVTLRDGRVVVIGGAQKDAEVYDPTTNTWTTSNNTLATTLKDTKAFELFDGRVFVPGGQDTANGLTTDETQFFDPDTGLFSAGPSMAGFNYAPPGITVQAGTSDYSAFDVFAGDPLLEGRYILIAGGEEDPLSGPDVELYSASIFDAKNNIFIDVGPMPFIHDDHTEADLGVNASGNPEFLLFGGNNSIGSSRFEFDITSIPEFVAINVKPETEQNPINLRSKGVLPVAILTSPSFNAQNVNVATVRIGDPALTNPALSIPGTPATPSRSAIEDVDGDGDADLILFFETAELVGGGALSPTSTKVRLTGKTFADDPLFGFDSVNIVQQ